MRHAVVLALLAACVVGDGSDDPDGGEYGEDAPPAPDDFDAHAARDLHETYDVDYTGQGDATHRLDVYAPLAPATAPRPVVIWIHGGGFAKNNRRDGHIVRLARETARLGFVAVSIDYTLANPDLDPRHPFPYPWSAVTAARSDALAALRYLRAHAAELAIDPQRVAVGGASAGAMTALEVAYLAPPAERDPGIRAVVDLWGAMEQQTLLQPGDAPLLVIHGTADDLWMPYPQAVRLRDSARAANVPCRFIPLPGKNHGPWGGLDAYLDDIRPFLRANL
jgi:acetyl esterase/lipase